MSGRLDGRLVVLGITGSIAAYKAVELLRKLTAEGAEVQVLMTHSARAFVGPLTLETLSGRPVLSDALELMPDKRIAHIVASERAAAIVVAPATARWLGAMAAGLADDVITATCLAAGAPVVVAPAMDGDMYAHPATRANVARLRSYGYRFVEPGEGALASGQIGRGRLAELDRILDAVVDAATATESGPSPASRAGDLVGRTIVVSAGGTAEPIDPVRFIGNRSTGRMGAAIAEAALDRGARVVLVAGNVSTPLPEAATIVNATTTSSMREAVLGALDGADVLVMAAAVADFRPRRAADTKLLRDEALVLELEPTEDILAEAGRIARAMDAATRPVLVGFSAETGALNRAAAKAERKGVDLMVANDVLEPGAGFAVDTNRVTLVVPGADPEPWPLMSKREVGDRLLDRVVALLTARDARRASASSRVAAGTASDGRGGGAESGGKEIQP